MNCFFSWLAYCAIFGFVFWCALVAGKRADGAV